MAGQTQTIPRFHEIVLKIPPSDRERTVIVSAWRNDKRQIRVRVEHDGIGVSSPVSIAPERRGEREMDVMDQTDPGRRENL